MKMKKIMGLLLAVTCIVTTIPAISYAAPKTASKTESSGDTNGMKNPKGVYGSPEEEGDYDFSQVIPNEEPATVYDRYAYDPQENEPALMKIDSWNDLRVNIAKRSEWVDKTNGDGKTTLYYGSNSGVYTGTEDMDVVLIQDKSGSMDPNYGFNLAITKNNYDIATATSQWYPIRNPNGWSENAAECIGYTYRNDLNKNLMGEGHMIYNSPCQDEGNRYFYLMIKTDANSPNLSAGQMVHGNNLYNISSTDLHSYYRLDTKEEALQYLSGGRRVIRCSSWIDDIGKKRDNQTYFLDVSQIYDFGNQRLLRTCDDTGESVSASRLAKSQWMMDKLVDGIQNLNSANKIAYIPFWGDVPNKGHWENASSGNSTTDFFPDNANQLTYKEGSTYMDFTDSSYFSSLKQQINHPFTYQGTNWSRALQKAIDLLNGRNAEEKKKKALVIFLTDGMPQGTNGKPLDVDNPNINGIGESAALKQIKDVTVYACGVGINRQDYDNILRLNKVDSKKKAFIAQYISEFDGLYNNIMNRIKSEFTINIHGDDTFYTDTISGPFTMDEAKLGNEWKILSSAGNSITKGVPTEVYQAAKAGAKYIYVRSTKTVYWHIGTMTDGDYNATGHSMSFPIKYAGYEKSTNGMDIHEKTNTIQKLTYVPSTNPNAVNTVNLATPTLRFNRENNPEIEIRKNVSGSSFTTDKSYRFAYSKNKCTGKVTNKEGNATVIVKAGSTSGTTRVSNLPVGTYYFYEVDENDNIISNEERKVTTSMQPEITTVNGDPVSVTTTTGVYNNRNNRLHIKAVHGNVEFTNHYTNVAVEKKWEDSNSSVRPDFIKVNLLKDGTKIDTKTITKEMGWKYTFQNLEKYDAAGREYEYTVTEERIPGYETKIAYTTNAQGKTAVITNKLMIADLTITKTIPSNADTIWWMHGNPTFMIRVSGTGLDGKNYTFHHTFAFDKEYVKRNERNGKVSMSYTFKNIPISKDYKCEEMTVSRWRLENVKGNGANVVVTNRPTPSQAEMFGIYADADLQARPQGTEVIFENVKDDYQWYNHITSVHNEIVKR